MPLFLTLVIRTLVMFAVILTAMRIMGKRQMGQLELSELVVAIMISELAVSPITNPDHKLWQGIVPVVVLLLSQIAISFLCLKSVRLRKFLIGTPSIVVQNGQINQKEMRKNRITLTELSEQLRAQGYTDIATVKHAILEINGSLSILPFNAHSPATHSANLTGNFSPEDTGLPVLIINDGRLLEENLKIMGLNRKWLEKQLNVRGVKDYRDVYFFSVDEQKNVYFAKKVEEQ